MKKLLHLSLLVLFCFGATFSFGQKTWDGEGDGESWNDPLNWSDNILPTSVDNVLLQNGNQVLITANANCNNLTLIGASQATVLLLFDGVLLQINGSLTIQRGTGSTFFNRTAAILLFEQSELSVSSDVIFNSNKASDAVIEMGGDESGITNSTLTIGGNINFNTLGLINNTPNSLIRYNGTIDQSIAAIPYSNLEISGSTRTITFPATTINITGNLINSSQTPPIWNVLGSTLNFNGSGNQTVGGIQYNNLTIADAVRTVTLSGNVRVAGTLSAGSVTNYYTSGSTVTFNGTSQQNIPIIPYENLTLNNPAGAILANNSIINGTLNLQQGALNIGQYTLTLNSIVNTTSGSLVGDINNSTLKLLGSGDALLPALTLRTLEINRSGNTITLGGESTISQNFTLTNGTFNLDANTLRVQGNFTNSGTFNGQNGTVEFYGGTTIDGTVVPTFNNVLISGAAGLDGSTFNVTGDWNTNLSKDVTIGQTVSFNGTTDQTINAVSNGFYSGFTNLIFTGSGQKTLASTILTTTNVQIQNGTLVNPSYTIGATNLTISGGGSYGSTGGDDIIQLNGSFTFDGSGFFNAPKTMTVKGNFYNNTAATDNFIADGGTIIFDFNGPQTIQAGNWAFHNILLGSTSASTKTLTGSLTVNGDLTINNYNTLQVANNNLDINGSAVINIGGVLSINTGNILLSGTWSNSGTFSHGTSNFILDGSGNQSIGGTNANYYNFTLANSGTVNSTGSFTVHNNFTRSATNPTGTFNAGSTIITINNDFIQEAGIINGQTATINVINSFILNGGTFTSTSGTLTLYNNIQNNGGTFNAGNGTSTVEFSGTANITGPQDWTFNNVTINSLTAPLEDTIKVTGNWTNNNNGFVHNNSTVAFIGNQNQQTNNGTTFYNLRVNKTTNPLTLSASAHNVLNTVKLQQGTLHTTDSLVLVSTASRTARLAKVESGANLSGSIVMQRYVSGKQAGWYYLGTPIEGQTLSSWNDDFIIRTNSSQANVGFWNEVANNWDMIYSLATPINPGRGVKAYWWAQSLSSGSLVFDNKGEPHIGDLTVNLTKTPGGLDDGGWNLVANPYPSDIDWDATGWTKNNINNSFYLWDGVNKGYKVYVGAGGDLLGTGSEGLTHYIPSSQAFFVYAESPIASLTFTEDVKNTENQNPTFLRKKVAQNELRIFMKNVAGNTDEAIIRFLDEGLTSYDKLDAKKLNGQILNISSIASDNFNLIVNSLPKEGDWDNVPIKAQAYTKGEFKLVFKGVSSFNEGKRLYLVDKFLNVKEELYDSLIYSFNITEDALSQGENRFEILFEDVVELNVGSSQVKKGVAFSSVVTVNNFKNILTAQFSIHWDKNAIEYLSVTEGDKLPNLNQSNFGLSNTTNGILSFSWDNASPTSINDGDTLFIIHYKAIGDKGDTSYVSIENTPTPLEIADINAQKLSVKTSKGLIYILNSKRISGNLLTTDGQLIKNPIVSLSSTSENLDFDAVNGNFEFDVEEFQDYSISPSYTNDIPMNNGVSTLDISLIRRHILGIKPLTSPYKILAADVDLSGNVSTIDISWIRKLVLGSINTFPGGNLWKFTPSDHVYDEQNPFPIISEKIVPKLSEDVSIDFIGLKLGDINDSWQSPLRITDGAELIVKAESIETSATEILVPIKTNSFRGIAGYQFTINWDPTSLELLDIINHKTNGNFGSDRIKDGILTTSWDESSGKSVDFEENDTLFILKLQVSNLNQSAFIDLNSSLTRMMAFNDDLVEVPLISQSGRVEVVKSFGENVKLFQNVPNPVNFTTDFKFYLPEADHAVLSIYNLTGQMVEKFEGNFDAGINIITWNVTDNKDIIKKGIYLYKLETSNFVESKRLIVK